RLEAAFRKRKIQLSGYLVAMVAWLVGMTMALIYFGMNDMSSMWAFLVPFGIVGVILYAFGAWAERVGRAPPPSPPPARSPSGGEPPIIPPCAARPPGSPAWLHSPRAATRTPPGSTPSPSRPAPPRPAAR